MPRERLLEPKDAEPLELSRDLDRATEPPGHVTTVAWLDAGLIRVDDQVDSIAELRADRLDDREVVTRVVVMEAELHRSKTGVCQSFGIAHPLLGRANLGCRAIREDPICVAAPELEDGEARDLPDDVPERDLHRVHGRAEDLGIA